MLRFPAANKPNSLILDFFSGSGTTLHAINLLNKEDGGHRRCIMVTNNEVSADEETAFRAKALEKAAADTDSLEGMKVKNDSPAKKSGPSLFDRAGLGSVSDEETSED